MKILYVEDEIAHVVLTQRTLEENIQQEFRLIHAETIKGALDCLDTEPDIDLILSDLRLPDGTGLDLLKKVRERKAPPPVVLVTGQGDEQIAVAALKAGAADYLVKQSDYLHRLPVVISNAIAQNQLTREQAALREMEQRFRILVEQMPAAVYTNHADKYSSAIYISPQIKEITGYSPDEWLQDPRFWIQRLHAEDRDRVLSELKSTYESRMDFNVDYRFIHRDGRVVWVRDVSKLILDEEGKGLYWQGILLDITKEKEDEAALQRQLEELAVLHATSLAASTALNIDQLIEQITNVIGNTLYPDNCGILLFDRITNTLKPHRSYRGTSQENLSKLLPVSQGITGRVASTGKPVRLGEVADDPSYFEVTEGVHAELCVPIISRGRVIGVINTESKKSNAFSERDEHLLITIANTLATATDKLRSLEEERQRAAELEALYQASRSLALSLEPEIIGRNLIATMDKLLGYEFASVHLLEDQSQLLVPLAVSQKAQDPNNYEKDREFLLSEKRRLGDGIIGWVAQHGELVRLGDVSKESRYFSALKNIKSELCVPLIARGRVIGVLNIESTQINAYTERDENLLSALANSAAIAFENARLYKSELTRREQAEALRTATASLSTALDLNTLYQTILDAAAKLVPYDSASIEIMNQGYLEIVAEYGLPTGYQHIGQKYMWDAKKWGEWEELWQDPKKPMILPDVQTDDRFIKREGSEYIRSWMGIPMAVGDKVFGLINIDNRKLNFYTEEHSAIIQTFANQAGIAIEKARLFETEKRHHREAELLREATASLATTLEFQPLLDTILEAISEFVVHDSASIFLENSQEEMEIAAVRGISNPENFVGEKVPKTEKWYQLATSHQALIIENSQIDTPLEKWEGAKYIRSWMSIPMTAQDKMIGYINLDSHRVNAFTERDATIAQTFANSAAIAIGNARLYQDAVQAAERRAVLHRISQDIIRFSQDIEQIYVAIHEAAGKLMPCDVFLITLRDEAKGENVSVYTVEAGDRYKLQGVPANQGLSAVVINNGKSIILRNEAEIGRREVFHFGSPRHVQSVAAVPMRINDKVIGMISAQCYEPYAYDIEEQALLEMLATHAATAIENGRLFESEQKRRQEAETLRQAATAISSTLDLNHVMKDILKALQQVIHYDNASVFLHEGDWLRLAVCQGFPNFENLVNQKFPANDELFEQIQETRRPIIITDAQKDPRFKNWGGSLQIHGWMAVPLITRGKVIGYISLDNYEPGAYNEANTETAMAFANQAAAGIENARLYDETQRRLKELEIINRISASLRMTQSVDEMLPILLNETLELINTPHGSIWLYDHYTDMLMQRVASGAEAKLKHTSIRPSEGIVGHTFRTEKKYTSYELKNDLLLFEGNRDSVTGGLGGICIPIQSTAGPVGVLMLSIETGRQIKEELNLLTILAEITGNSIHRAQLYDQSQRQVRRLTSLRDIDAAIASSFDLRLTLNILMDQTLSHLNVDAVDIGLYHPDLQILTYLTGVGFNVPSPTRPQVRLGEGLAGQVLIKQETYHVTDMQKAAGTKDELLIKREKFVTYIGVPLIVKGQIKGIFEVFHRSPLSTTPDWMEFLHTLAGQAAIAIDSSQLFENLQRSNQELIQAYDTTLEGWARALELRDRETEGHTRRVTELTLRLARYMKIGENEMVNIHRGVLLHDIGKMGVPDHILKKTGKLTDDEWGEMRQHPIYAYNLLSPILFLRGVLDIPYCHHEHWDGSGYPRGLKGEQIPLAARIFSVVDIWDALLSDRPYRKAWPRKAVIDYLQEVAGKILDPKIVPIFLTMIHTDEEQTG